MSAWLGLRAIGIAIGLGIGIAVGTGIAERPGPVEGRTGSDGDGDPDSDADTARDAPRAARYSSALDYAWADDSVAAPHLYVCEWDGVARPRAPPPKPETSGKP